MRGEAIKQRTRNFSKPKRRVLQLYDMSDNRQRHLKRDPPLQISHHGLKVPNLKYPPSNCTYFFVIQVTFYVLALDLLRYLFLITHLGKWIHRKMS